MGGVTIQYWAISSNDLTRVIKDNNLSEEILNFSGWVVFGIRGNISSFDFFN
jgi:hypothetical protein